MLVLVGSANAKYLDCSGVAVLMISSIFSPENGFKLKLKYSFIEHFAEYSIFC
jgi:hypothetical protein